MTVQQLADRLAALVAQGLGGCSMYVCDGDHCFALGDGDGVVSKWDDVPVSVDVVDDMGVVVDMTAE
jgi:hypothetical protein